MQIYEFMSAIITSDTGYLIVLVVMILGYRNLRKRSDKVNARIGVTNRRIDTMATRVQLAETDKRMEAGFNAMDAWFNRKGTRRDTPPGKPGGGR